MWSKLFHLKKQRGKRTSHRLPQLPSTSSPFQEVATSSARASINPRLPLEEVGSPDALIQLRSLALREDLPVESMIELRSAFFDFLTMDGENITDVQKLNEAISAGESLIKILPPNHKACSKYSDRLGFVKASRYNASKNELDINDAISLSRQALCLISKHDSEFANVASNLAYSLSQRHKATQNLDDLDESIRLTREVVGIATSDTPENHGNLLNLGSRLYLRYQITGELENSNEALAVTHQVLQLSKSGSREHSAALLNLGVFSGGKYEKTGFWKDIEEAIRLQKSCMSTSMPYSDSRFHCTSNLGSLYYQRFTVTKNISDLKEAVHFNFQAVKALPLSDSMQSTRGHYLTIYLRMLTELARAITEASEVERAISEAADLMQPMPRVYADLILNLQSYGDLHSRKYELSGHPMDLHQNVTAALTFASQFNQVTGLKGGSTRYDTNTLLILYNHAGKLATEPQGDPLVVQVVEAMHKEYLKLVETRSFVDALIKLEKDLCINVQIVIIASRSKSVEEMKKEGDEKVEYVKSLGAKTFQLRFKFVDYTIQDRQATISADPTQELSESLANCTFGQAGGLLTDQM